MEVLVFEMAEYKKEIVRSSIVALLVVALLSGVSCHFFPQFSLPKEPFVFAWTEGNSSYIDTAYEVNETLKWLMLEFWFTFANGSSIHEPNLDVPKGQPVAIGLEYHGELNATSLQWIGFSRTGVGLGSSCNTILMDINTTIGAALETAEVNDLGTFEEMNWHENRTNYGNGSASIGIGDLNQSYSGYWKKHSEREFEDVAWMMYTDQLSGLIPDSGVAWITFNATVNVDILYEITIGGETRTGETTLQCERTIGTIEITYDKDEMLWVKYDFQGISLLLLTLSE
jgi:hypothetical protein